jgi:hypothetical protein
MFKFKHSTLITIGGALWMTMGIFLMNMGLRLIAEKSVIIAHTQEGGLLKSLSSVFGGIEEAGIALIGIALAIGYFKGRFVLAKTVAKMVARIRTFKAPVSLRHIYAPKFYLLIGLMMGLGFLFRVLQVPHDVRGVIDVAVGAALINGAVLYFKQAKDIKKEEQSFS